MTNQNHHAVKLDHIPLRQMPHIALLVIRRYGFKTFFHKTKNFIKLKLSNKKLNLPFTSSLNASMNPLASKSKDIVKKIPVKGSFHALLIVGCSTGESKRYRVYNVAEYLKLAGMQTTVIEQSNIPDVLDQINQFDLVYFSRSAYDSSVERLIAESRKRNIITIFEVDDLVFDLSVIHYVDAIKDWKQSELNHYKDGILRYQKTLRECDYFIATTDYLTVWANKQLGKKGYIIRNALNAVQMQESAKASHNRISPQHEVRIGYFSGSKTHQKDFAQAEEALVRILTEFPSVTVSIGGHLELSPRFDAFKERITRIPFTDWKQLPHEIAKIDINIVPLELNNPYCESKSELKYYEAGIVGVPSIASPTNSYRFAITDGENGYLAHNSEEWYRKLKRLVENSQLRAEMAKKAYEHSMKQYSPESMQKQTMEIFDQIIDDYRKTHLKLEDGKLVINWVIPEPSAGSGGHRNIFRAVKFLRQFGHYVRVYSLIDHLNFSSSKELGDYVNKEFFPTDAEFHLGVEKFAPADAFIATHWSTVDTIWKNRDKAKKLFYFVQDYEPYFVSMGNEYIEAENTYKLGLHCITSGQWCTTMLREKFNADADFFLFPINRDVYHVYPDIPVQKKVIFFARPEMPRRCYPLGIKALALFAERNPEVEIVIYGSQHINPKTIPFKHTLAGALPTINDLAKLYASGTVGIAFSTTNPSLVPYEMMACGLPVIDLDYGDSWSNYGSRENAMLVDTFPEKIAEGIEKVVRDPHLREKLSKNGLEFVKKYPTEEETAKRIEQMILKVFNDGYLVEGSVVTTDQKTTQPQQLTLT